MHVFLGLLEETIVRLPSGYRFTLKPHPGYAVRLADYPGLPADETTEALDRILCDYDVAIAANSTSAAVDAYHAGLRVIVAMDGAEMNLSPLRGRPGVRFVGTPGELADALRVGESDDARDPARGDFFFLDAGLPRWQQLLATAGAAPRA